MFIYVYKYLKYFKKLNDVNKKDIFYTFITTKHCVMQNNNDLEKRW